MNKKNLNILSILILSLIFNVLFFNQSLNIQAKEHTKVIDSLMIENKKDQYYPGETIRLKGSWSIPDDTVDVSYKEGDTFSISIPDGLNPNFTKIDLSGLAIGVVVGDKIVFTFTNEVEDLVDREGGFNVRFTVKDPGDEGEHNVDIVSYDPDGNEVLKELIIVNKPVAGEVGPTDEIFAKGKMSQTDDGLQWYIRINHNGKLQGSTTRFEDKLGPDHIMKPETLQVREHTEGNQETNVVHLLDVNFDSDLKGFQINNLPLTGGYKGYKYYTLYYETEYTGNETSGEVGLNNSAQLTTEKQGLIYPGHNQGDGIVTGTLDLDSQGWGKGTVARSFKLRKLDSVTKEPLKGAKFRLSHKIDSSFTPIEFTTDENGEYKHPTQIKNGTYILEELEAPVGYKKIQAQEVRISKETNDFEIIVENELLRLSLDVNKQWFDHKGNEIDSQTDIAIALFANDKKIMQKVLLKGESSLSFTNLRQRDVDGTPLKYRVEEVDIPGYTQSITGSMNEGFLIINTAEKPPIIIEPTPETVALKVTKKWIGTPLDSINVDLLQNDNVIDTISLSELNEWTYEFNNLTKFDEDNVEYSYSLREHNYENYNSLIEGSIIDGFVITNIEKEVIVPNKGLLDIPIRKIWIGNPKDSIIVHLLRDGIKVDSKVLSDDNEWYAIFEDLEQKDSEGHTYIYTVQEEIISGYINTVTGSMHEGFIITNTEIKNPPIEPNKPEDPKSEDNSKAPDKVVSQTPSTGINNSSIIYGVIILVSLLSIAVLNKKKTRKIIS